MKLSPILFISSATAFAPNRLQWQHIRLYDQPVKEANGASTIDDVEGAFNIGDMPTSLDENAKKKKIAKDALNKLLERQQRDVQQTLDLIQNLDLENIPISSYEHDDDSTSTTTTAARAPAIAQSVAMGADYGYISRSEGCRSRPLQSTDARFTDYGPPGNILTLGADQFTRNLRAMFNEYTDEDDDDTNLTAKQRELQSKLSTLTLDSAAIWARERSRGPLVAPWIIKLPYLTLCYLLDVVFENKNPFCRFFLLETVARMPYFSYITMLHLYETLGFWRRSADIKRIHFAEEWNEFHHLLIMESLGGDQPYWVRFMAQHSALAYYIALCVLWAMSPTLSYKFSEMLETHAVDTYGQFVDENEEALNALPPSMVAVEYYTVGVSDPMFGEYQTASVSNPDRGVRKPGVNLKSLYDVFVAIRNDEGDHVSTMKSCLDPKEVTLSPALESRVLTGVALASAAGYFFGDSATLDSLAGSFKQLSSGGGLEGLSDLAVDGSTDLDSVLTEAVGSDSSLLNGVVGGLGGLASGIRELTGLDPELDEDAADAAGSALEDVAVGGFDGLELEGIMEVIRNIAVGILELIGML